MGWVERTDKRTRKARVWQDDTDPTKFKAELHIDDVHYHDGSAWQPVDESFVADGTVGKKCEKTRHILKVGNGGTRTWYPRREVPTEYFSITEIEYYTTRWRKLTMPTPAWTSQVATWDMTNLTATLTNTWRQSKAEFILKNSSAYTRLRFAYTLVGLTWDGWSLRSIADGTIVGWVTPPVAWDATVQAHEAAGNVPVTATNDGSYIEYSVNTAGKTFPITVDPTFTDGYGGDVDTAFDTRTNEASPTDIYSAAWNMWEGKAGAGTRSIPLIKFVVSSLSGNTVSATTFYCYVGFQVEPAVNWSLHSILAANSGWTEDCCWNHKDGEGASQHWAGDTGADHGTDAGCSVSGTDYNGTAIGTFTQTANAAAGTEFTASLNTTQVQSWIDDGHYGMLGIVDQFCRMCSSDHATTGYRPKLVIEYSSGGGTAVLAAKRSLLGVGV